MRSIWEWMNQTFFSVRQYRTERKHADVVRLDVEGA
jgi:hypothetical protein